MQPSIFLFIYFFLFWCLSQRDKIFRRSLRKKQPKNPTFLQRSTGSSRNYNVFFFRGLIGERALISVQVDLLSNINFSISYHGDVSWEVTPLLNTKKTGDKPEAFTMKQNVLHRKGLRLRERNQRICFHVPKQYIQLSLIYL